MREMPAVAEHFAELTAEYRTLPGWNSPTFGVRDADRLPEAARQYLRFISDFLQIEIGMISTGPERDATIVPSGTKLGAWL
jgi:adenylosuccinate synthase